MMQQRMYHHSQGNSFSMVFGHGQYRAAGYNDEDEEEMYSFTTSSSSPSPSVDCTLSLGTPSTRLTNDVSHHQEKKRSSCGISNFGWNILPSSKHAPPPSAAKSNRAGNNNADTLLARRCANCDTTSTPLWRNGPRGPKSLCNACGIRFKKEERRATAAAAASTAGGGGADTQHMMTTSNWVQAQRMGCYSSAYGNEFRFMEEDDSDHQNHHRDSSDSAAVPFLSWRFNVADRPAGLVHDFTR